MAKKYENLTLSDHFMFGKVAGNKHYCELILESLLDEKVRLQDIPDRERLFQVKKDGKFVRLDLYAEDEKRIFDAEMQNKSQNANVQKELPLRSRYYQSMMDTNFLKQGMTYRDLKEGYVIFICNFDPFDRNFYKYVFFNTCEEEPDLQLGDGAYRIFFNTKANLEEAPKKLRDFFDYLRTNKPNSDITKQLDDAVQEAKLNEEWGREYMLSIVHDMDVLYTGREEGRLISKRESIYDFLQELGDISESVKLRVEEETDIDTLRKWVKIASSAKSISDFVNQIS